MPVTNNNRRDGDATRQPLPAGRFFAGRREDRRLVTGQGRYTADHTIPEQAMACFLRADRAHARVLDIDTSAARDMSGVVGILTGKDIVAAGLKSPRAINFFKGIHGTSLIDPARPHLAHGKVRFVGEPVALVIAETEHQAADAAAAIVVEYEDLPPVVRAADAIAPQAEAIHGDAPGNLALLYEYGDRAAVDRSFAGAAHVVSVELDAQRISGNPMEPKSCLAQFNVADGTFDLYLPSQGTADLKYILAQITGLDVACFRIHSIDVGGGFGVRNEIYPEFVALLQAARQFGRPVKWIGTRSETLSGDHHGRAAVLKGQLACDGMGKFTGLRVEWLVDLGAYCSHAGPLINTVAAPTTSAMSLYNIDALFGRHQLVFTNTTPTTAYRGAGRPNVAYLWERLVEEAARKIGISSIQLRRRNLIKKEQFPFKTLTGSTYDSGDPSGLLDAALKESDWDSFEARRRTSRRAGRLRGIGLSLFIEPSGGAGQEAIKIEVCEGGKLALLVNAGPSGQGHETAFVDIVADILGLPPEGIALCYNYNDRPALAGTGSYGSRSLISHGSALALGAREIVRKGRDFAASELEVAPGDLVFEAGQYCVPGTDLAVGLQALLMLGPPGEDHPLNAQAVLDTATAFPSGAHVAEVEIDPETGHVEILKYVAVDDCGAIYNQMLVHGQMLGGLMQGIGQALGEHIVYDKTDGQLLSGSFMDYFMPKAHHLPHVTLKDRPVPSPFNPLGAKGAGEAGATGSIPAIANAVLDALKTLQIHHLDMPFSPSRIWTSIQESKKFIRS